MKTFSISQVIKNCSKGFWSSPLTVSCASRTTDPLTMQAIEALPLVQTPEVFGLHANADIQYYTNATKALWQNLVELQPRTAGTGTGITREELIEKTAKDILQALPDTFDMPQLRKELGLPSPTQVVLLQELERWNQCAP